MHAGTNFSDIDNSYAKQDIMQLVELGILNGTGKGQFLPRASIQRQDFAIIIAKALNLDVTSAPANATFSDIPTSNYAYKYVEAAAQAGLIQGAGDGSFGGHDRLTRQDLAVIFGRALNFVSGEDLITGKAKELKFTDIGNIATYAKDAVGAAYELGYMTGNGNQFDPTGQADRAQIAVVSSKFLKAKEIYAEAQIISAGASSANKTEVRFSNELELSRLTGIQLRIKTTGEAVEIQNTELSADKKSVSVSTAALALGTTYTVSYTNKSIEFTTPVVDKVEVSVSKSTAYPGEGVTFTAKGYAGAQLLEGYSNLTFSWAASGGNVDSKGQFTGYKVGSETISADWNGVQGSASVNIIPWPVTVSSSPTPVPDTINPVLSDVSAGPFAIGTAVQATSNENGTIYLVSEDATIEPTVEKLEQFSGDPQGELLRMGKKVNATAGQSASVSTVGFMQGNYYFVAVDASGNLSLKSSQPVKLGVQPTLSQRPTDAGIYQFSSAIGNKIYVVPSNSPAVTTQSQLDEIVADNVNLKKSVTISGYAEFLNLNPGEYRIYAVSPIGLLSSTLTLTVPVPLV